ncbi:DUF3280 domain-containing protein [Paracraurococcus ruber]|uniref:DUF2380 domain-containing protein n=1 Tax=Paracraurococcus ruber TaxID=77675 RepID=A0ABS1D0V8_9PROT|nr:DUF3280 domain-containing protein [Paracraurococcus ruber]MBK1659554.1 hypothetical protein [Paracraurococcus ruber]TDG33090.1 DUF2380 domain-containing protein [Paracraurococcus ruber]
MRSTRRAAWLPLLLALAALPVRAADRVAVFDAELLDSSGEGPKPEQQQRLAMIAAQLREALAASGRYEVVEVEPQRARLAEGPALRNCAGCAAEAAASLGASLALVTTVQKVSNLILNITVVVLEAPSARPRATWSVDIRGNTDESWRHGMRWLLRHRLLAAPEPGATSASPDRR